MHVLSSNTRSSHRNCIMNYNHDEHMEEGHNESPQHARTMNHDINSTSRTTATAATTQQPQQQGQLHPLQLEHQQQPWLIPHPNLPISWRNNDRAHSHEDSYGRHSGDQYQPPHPFSATTSTSLQRFNNTTGPKSNQRPNAKETSSGRTSQLHGFEWRTHNQQQLSSAFSSSAPSDGSQLRQYHESIAATYDQGHESDPSDLLRPPVLFNNGPLNYSNDGNNSSSFAMPQPIPSSLDRHGRDIYPMRRNYRSMSLSMSPGMWNDEREPRELSSLSRNHGEVVPYSQEWRVILRSQPRGRTVLYNPQMQSLVVQTTVGLDSHPMSLHNERICALCRRPLDLNETTGEQDDSSSSFMDMNYFRVLADANTGPSRQGSLQEDPGTQFQSHSPIGSPASSGRVSIDLDNQMPSRDDNSMNNSTAGSSNEHSRSNTQENPSSPHLSNDALNQGYYNRFFIEQKKLGRGFRGSVFLCQHVLDGIHLGEYAIKKVAVGDNHNWLVQMLREVHLLERLHHPNIVAYKHAWLENHQLHKFGPEVACLFILMECANGGNLEEYIEQPPDSHPEAAATSAAGADGSSKEAESKKHMTARERVLQSKRQRLQGSMPSPTSAADVGSPTERGESQQPPRRHLSITEIWSFFFDICEGLGHLHRLGIIHRDLKPPNLLLSYSSSQVKGTKGERPRILITDFGECEILDQAAKRDRTGATGTLEFLAPELLAVDANGRYTDEFSFKGDMWSLGMVLYYLCYSRLPYSQIEDVDILRTEIRQFTSIQIPDDEHDEGHEDRIIPEELKILIRVLLSPEKSKRPSCDDILSTLSHQRDRMMHGDMDVPATPIRASSSTSAAGFNDEGAKAEEAHEVNGYRTDENEGAKDKAASTSASTSIVTTERRLSTSRGSRDLQLHRQHYHPFTQRMSGATTTTAPAASGSGRRLSRTTLLTSEGSNSSHLSPIVGGTRHTASPGVSLHKRVKPLGLGLRHMLRRKTMFPTSTGIGAQRYPRSSDVSHGRGHSTASDSRVTSFPLPPKNSQIAASVSSGAMVKSPPHLDMDMWQQSQFQKRKQAAATRAFETSSSPLSALGIDIDQYAEPQSGQEIPTTTAGAPSVTRESMGEQRLSPPPGRMRSSRDGLAMSAPVPTLRRESLGPDFTTDPASNDSDRDNESNKDHRPRIRKDARNDTHGVKKRPNNTLAQSRPALGKSYWSSLASTHTRERSTAPATDVSSSAAAAAGTSGVALLENGSSDDSSGASTSGAGVGTGQRRRSRDQASHRPSLDRERPNLRQRSVPHNALQKQKQKPSVGEQKIQHLPSRRPSLQQNRQEHRGLLPEHLSTHFSFISLVARIWFCLSICNPIMVRPLVLYPILVMTVVWDRYVLSLIAEKFRAKKSSSMASSLPPSSSSAAAGSLSSTRLLRNGHDGPLGGITHDEGETEGREGYGGDEDSEGATDRNSRHRSSEGGLITKPSPSSRELPSQRLQDDHSHTVLVWQALLSGIILQMLWIGAIWLFSRDGLCIV